MSSDRATILIAGVGNIFRGDDAFGVELAQRLMARKLPESVRVVDFGIRSLDLAYALLDGYDVNILLDATPRGGPPGTLYVIEPDWRDLASLPAQAEMETHGMNPMRALRAVKSFGGELKRVLLVGCEPLTLGSEEEGKLGLSPVVMLAVDEGVALVESLVAKSLREQEVAV